MWPRTASANPAVLGEFAPLLLPSGVLVGMPPSGGEPLAVSVAIWSIERQGQAGVRSPDLPTLRGARARNG